MTPACRALVACFVFIAVSRAPAATPADWTWQNPLPQGNDLAAVWGRAADDVYAIGGDQTLLHWDGAGWSVASRPQSMPVVDMWGLDSGTLFAVGWYGVVLRFDGAAWTPIPFPPGAHLTAVVAFSESEVFVAEAFPGRRLWEYQGAGWTEIGTAPDGIHDLGGSGADDIYAVGFEGMMTHWDGQAWTPVGAFSPFDITSVWSNDVDDVFALGQGALLYHFDGDAWTQVGSDATSAWRSGMWGTSFNDLWFGDEGGGLSHFDGATVTTYDVPSHGFVGVWGDGLGNVHCVGPSGSVASYDGAQWTAVSSTASNENLLAFWRVSDDEAYAGGSLESAIRWDGAAWTSIRETAFSVWFTDIWASGPGDVFFVGKAGIKHWDGAGWTPMDDGLITNLTHNGVWGFGPDDVVAVADWGAIVRYDGVDWTIERAADPAQGNLNAVWGSGPDDIWAVGPRNYFLHWDGLAWNEVPMAMNGWQIAVHGFAHDDVWVLGEGGELRHWDGVAWTFDGTSFPGTVLTGIHGATPDDLHVVAQWGAVYHHEGDGTWTMVDTGGRTGLNDIWAGPGGVHVVGQGGAVLYGASETTDVPEFAAGARLNLRNEPNPFNPGTTIRFDVPRAGPARLTIHDAAGRRVATLIDGEVPAGPQAVTWDGRDTAGRRLASGAYLAQVRTGSGREVRKLTLVK